MTRDQSILFNKNLRQHYKDKIQIKCIADEIWLYSRYLFDSFDELVRNGFPYEYDYKQIIQLDAYKDIVTNKHESPFYKELETIYSYLRGESFYLGKKPSVIGAAIFALCLDTFDLPRISRKMIAHHVCISEVGLRRGIELVKKNIESYYGNKFLPRHYEQTKCPKCSWIAVFYRRMRMFECSKCNYRWNPLVDTTTTTIS